LRIAARFFDRSADTKTFKRGMDAHNNPDFYRQLGNVPEQIVRSARGVGEAVQSALIVSQMLISVCRPVVGVDMRVLTSQLHYENFT
jgi:hypothetical protein